MTQEQIKALKDLLTAAQAKNSEAWQGLKKTRTDSEDEQLLEAFEKIAEARGYLDGVTACVAALGVKL